MGEGGFRKELLSHVVRTAALVQLWALGSRIEDICLPLPLSSTFPGLSPCHFLSQTTGKVDI